ncbi:glycosyltransferase family 2 protein [Thalassovita sp.]|uniref:glycosyltransferase n=1 Tax=Thalassovita sp. TaxID=1979401 RepID=UPI0029DE61D8|nr:glycosyltransferase family 2 protein [Thalassovita sp.]
MKNTNRREPVKPGMTAVISIIIPASNEERLIGPCLSALLASDPVPEPVQVVVVANGCRDRTAQVAISMREAAETKGWALAVLDLPEGGKPGALNAGDGAAAGDIRVYLDADVTVDAALLGQIAQVLDVSHPRFASGSVRMTARGFASRAYRQIWRRVPFFAQGVPGCGLYAVNAAGRRRWGEFPDIISDDTFVRLSFAADERVGVPAGYDWPIVEGVANLIKVRRRQNVGVDQVERLYPERAVNADDARLGKGAMLGMMLRHPVGFSVYTLVAVMVKLTQNRDDTSWSRGR